MQSLGAVTDAQLKASAQVPLAKFEIYYGGGWVDICALGGVNYLLEFSVSLGGATMTPDPVAGSWSATIDNPDGVFFPANTSGSYYDYFTTGRLVRISTGGTYAGSDTYWNRLIGVMASPKFTIKPARVQLQGMDYSQYLSDYKLRLPDNYWGDSTVISTVGPDETLGAEIYDEADACEIGAHEANNVTNWSGSVAAVSSVADAGGGSTYVMKMIFGAGAVVKTYSTAGNYSWLCPTGVTSIQVECWGGGGAGGGSHTFFAGGGGGGGAYAKTAAVTVVPGTTYTVHVGAKGLGAMSVDGTSGGASWFGSTSTVKAAGGAGGEAAGSAAMGHGGSGGLAASCVGDTKYKGGDGGDGNAGYKGAGGGGGSSAGTGSAGNDGDNGGADTGGNGGAAVAGGGVGGTGGDDDESGHQPASGNGGGGGGGGWWEFADYPLEGGDGKAGKVVLTYTGVGGTDSIVNSNVGAVTSGQMYKVAFQYKRVTGPGVMAARAYIGTSRQDGEATGLDESDYTSAVFYFTASATSDLQLYFDIEDAAAGSEFRVDEISVKPVTWIHWNQEYTLPTGATGIYCATLDGVALEYGADPDGYYYDSVHSEFQFHPNSTPLGGTNDLVVYYYTAQVPEEVVADILGNVNLYADGEAALAAMTYTATGISIDRVWFEAGGSALSAIRKICERCNYRFYFKYDGTPAFIPAPSIKAAGSEDATLEEYHISDPVYYEDASEIHNTITINGESIAQPLGTEQTMASNYTGTDSDVDSIDSYGNRTESIDNHLFQSDADCASMAATLLAEYKDPKKYLDFTANINAMPIEIGDTLSVKLKVTTSAGYGSIYDLFLYDSGALYDTSANILTVRGLVRDIKLSGADAMYKLELA